METPQFASCAVKALIVHDGHFLALSKKRWAERTGIKWNDLPGGRVDHGELDPYQALQRELREEIGRDDVDIIRPIHMTTVVCHSKLHAVATVFLCQTSSRDITLSDEHCDAAWLRLDDPGYRLATWIEASLSVSRQ